MLALILEPAGGFRNWLIRTLDEAGIGHVEVDDIFASVALARSMRAEVAVLGPTLDAGEAVTMARRLSAVTAVVAFAAPRDADGGARLERAGASATLRRPIGPDAAVEAIRAAAIDRFVGPGARRIDGRDGAAVDLRERALAAPGGVASLRPLEYRVAEILALRRGEFMSRDEILDRLYSGRAEAAQKIVDVTICTLRRKLRDVGCGALIETRRGGYAFALPEDRHAAPACRSGRPAHGPAPARRALASRPAA